MNINGAFRFHKVGQGLFYSGLLSKKDGKKHDVFSFVYDCGTSSSKSFLQQEINDYKLLLKSDKSSGNKKLNLLVVSHLHDDHVNGLEYLLKNVDVDAVVMPYLYDELKLLVRLESHSKSRFLLDFYNDPIGWFASKGVKKICLVGAEETWKESDGYLNGNRQNSEDNLFDINDIIRQEKYRGTNETEIIYLTKDSHIRYKDFHWDFYFENIEQDREKIESYIEIVNDYKENNHVTLQQILNSKRRLKEFKSKVKNVFANNMLNRTSVALLHRPTVSGVPIWRNTGSCQCCYHCDKATVMKTLGDKICGTLLTGDLVLDKGEDLEIFHISADKKQFCCAVFQYPHHGADNDGKECFTELQAFNNVISYGLLNKYGHPHSEALSLPNVILVNEREAFDYQILV